MDQREPVVVSHDEERDSSLKRVRERQKLEAVQVLIAGSSEFVLYMRPRFHAETLVSGLLDIWAQSRRR